MQSRPPRAESGGDHGDGTDAAAGPQVGVPPHLAAVADPDRVAALRRSALLGADAEETFDRLTRLAVRLARVPAAFISLVDAERDFYLSACGFGEPLATAREMSGPTFCHYAIASPGPLVIPDTAAHPVYRHVPTVRSLGVAAYVGVPIRTAEGHALGSFCAIDVKPRAWSTDEVEILQELAASAEREIGLRAAAVQAARLLDAANAERQRLAAVLGALPIGVLIADASGRLSAGTGNTGRIWQAATGRDGAPQSLDDYRLMRAWRRDTGEPVEADAWPMVRALRHGESSALEIELRPAGSARLVVVASAVPVRDAAGRIDGAVVTLLDLTERVSLEEQLAQAQKMDAVGQLAGGVAHDFNNLLTVIAASREFALLDLPADHAVRGDLDEIGRACDRAGALVRQLLAFSREQTLQPRVVDLGELVRGAETLLRRVIGEEVLLDVHLGAGPALVRADPGQLEQLLVNLAINARDAMLTALHGHPGTGGTLEIAVDRVVRSRPAGHARARVEPGEYVQLVVRDTGHGMDADTRARAFEPFFTTKDVGRGTGLGLAIVFGVVRQAAGAIDVESAPGRGTSITVLLPAAAGEAAPEAATPAPEASADHPAAVLLVEDERTVRSAARRILERRGYTVFEARHGADALRVWQEERGRIDAVVTDIRMPELGGPELVARLEAEAPELPVVYVSGYSDDGAIDVCRPGVAVVEKPFTADALLTALRRVLHTPACHG